MTIAFHLRIESFVNDLPQIGEGKYTTIEDKINEAMRACNGNVGQEERNRFGRETAYGELVFKNMHADRCGFHVARFHRLP